MHHINSFGAGYCPVYPAWSAFVSERKIEIPSILEAFGKTNKSSSQENDEVMGIRSQKIRIKDSDSQRISYRVSEVNV